MEKRKNIQFYNTLPAEVIEIINKLTLKGFPTYIVGGACRSFLLNMPVHDIDLCTAATPEQMIEILSESYQLIDTGRKFGTMTVVTASGQTYELTTFRSDSYKGLSHDECEIQYSTTLEDDLLRRDFTINAIAYSIQDKSFYDYFGGFHDIELGAIRTINPKYGESFRQDPLRMLRALRFRATLAYCNNNDDRGFFIDSEAYHFISHNGILLNYVSAERIRDELTRLLQGWNVVSTIRTMLDMGVLDILLPEVANQSRLQQHNIYHKEYYDHNLTLFDHCMSVVGGLTTTDPIARWVALLHDIGKVNSIHVHNPESWNYYGHPDESATMTEKICERLKFSNHDAWIIRELVRLHDAPFSHEGAPHKKKIKRLMGEEIFIKNPDLIFTLLEIKRADILAHDNSNGRQTGLLKALEETHDVVHQIIADNEALTIHDLKVKGDAVMHFCGVHGPRVGEILCELLEKVIDEELPNERDALIDYLKQIKE